MTPRDELAWQIFRTRACTPDEAYAAADAWLVSQPKLHQHDWHADLPGRQFCICGATQQVP